MWKIINNTGYIGEPIITYETEDNILKICMQREHMLYGEAFKLIFDDNKKEITLKKLTEALNEQT